LDAPPVLVESALAGSPEREMVVRGSPDYSPSSFKLIFSAETVTGSLQQPAEGLVDSAAQNTGRKYVFILCLNFNIYSSTFQLISPLRRQMNDEVTMTSKYTILNISALQRLMVLPCLTWKKPLSKHQLPTIFLPKKIWLPSQRSVRDPS
jgi:hypothetical protein